MYEPQRLPGMAIPLATPLTPQRSVDVDPVGMWNSFVGTLTRRARLFALVVIGVIAAVALVTLLTPKRYTTDAKIIAGNPNSIAQNPQQAQTGLPVLNALLIGNAAQSAETYAELMGETPVVRKVIDNLHLQTDVATLKSALKVKPVTNTSILSLQISWSDPETSARIANEFATVFVDRQRELMSGQANGAVEQLARQLPPAQHRLLLAEQELSKYEISHNIADLSTQTTSTVNEAINTDQKINQVQDRKSVV